MANGGKRAGAGRPKAKRTLAAEMFRDFVAEQITEHQAPIIKKMIVKAKGGDVMAFRELLDRAFGKAVQAVDLNANGEIVVKIKKEWK